MKKFKNLVLLFTYFICIALVKGLWGTTENYWLKFLAVTSPLLILGAVNGYKSSKQVRVVALLIGLLGVLVFTYFI
ncbi:MAG: hypothetical protein GQ583_10270 [Methyloprofundus sp.]|nr:hypothetical protein [Methyloprofundus sp.]